MKKVAIIGHGYVGQAFSRLFPEAVIYDEPKIHPRDRLLSRLEVNKCDLAVVCVPTPQGDDKRCDTSIVEDVIGWLETPLICIKSTIEPGTVDRLKSKFNKRITYSTEVIGEGGYTLPYWKYPHPTDPTMHQQMVIGGAIEDTNAVAEIFWSRLSPDLDIHQVTAVEAELTKYMLNSWASMKISFANTFYDLCRASGANYINVLQAFGADGRVEKMHMRVIEGKRGYDGKCLPKDTNAINAIGKELGVRTDLLQASLDVNEYHRSQNG